MAPSSMRKMPLGCKTGKRLADLHLEGADKEFTTKFSKVNTLRKGRSGHIVRKKPV